MKKIIAAVAVAVTVFAPQAFAQAKNFEGFSLGANLNIASSTTEITSTIFNGKSTESGQNLGLQGQYNFALGDSFVLGVGFGAGLGDLKAGTITSGGTTLTIKQKEAYSVYVAPGVAINDSVLLYGKVAAISGKFESSAATTSTTAVSGVGYGFGVQSYINKNLFIQGEFMQNNYADRTFAAFTETDKNNASVFSIGIGYKF